MNHKAECLIVVPVPNRAYYEVRTACVCGLHEPLHAKPSEESVSHSE